MMLGTVAPLKEEMDVIEPAEGSVGGAVAVRVTMPGLLLGLGFNKDADESLRFGKVLSTADEDAGLAMRVAGACVYDVWAALAD